MNRWTYDLSKVRGLLGTNLIGTVTWIASPTPSRRLLLNLRRRRNYNRLQRLVSTVSSTKLELKSYS